MSRIRFGDRRVIACVLRDRVAVRAGEEASERRVVSRQACRAPSFGALRDPDGHGQVERIAFSRHLYVDLLITRQLADGEYGSDPVVDLHLYAAEPLRQGRGRRRRSGSVNPCSPVQKTEARAPLRGTPG